MAFYTLMQQLWQDDCGGIITAEYLLLGSVLTVGTISGMTALRDATVNELQESGNSMRAVREHFAPNYTTIMRPANNGPSRNQARVSDLYGCENGICP